LAFLTVYSMVDLLVEQSVGEMGELMGHTMAALMAGRWVES
jgi:hypothetical protein